MRALFLALLLATACSPAWAQNGAQSCRDLTAAVMAGHTDEAAAAIMPPGAADQTRRAVDDLVHRLTDSAEAVRQHRPARLERVLPDRRLGPQPVSLEIWSIDDAEVYLVGCAIRPVADGRLLVSIQAYPTLPDVMDHLGQALGAGDPGP